MDLRGKGQCLRLLQQWGREMHGSTEDGESLCYVLEQELRELVMDGMWQTRGGVRNEPQISGLSTWQA